MLLKVYDFSFKNHPLNKLLTNNLFLTKWLNEKDDVLKA